MALGKGLGSLIPNTKARGKTGGKAARSASESLETSRIWHIPISEIAPNPHQPRRNFDHAELEDLVMSIKKHGILQPLLVSDRGDGGYELIAGERRLRAATIAGLSTVPCVVKSTTDQEKLELALIENIQRQDLNPIEEAFAFARLVDEFGLTQQQVAEAVGKSRPVVANTIRLLDLPDPIKKALIDGKLGTSKALAMLSLRSEKDIMAMFKTIMGSSMTLIDVERSVAGHGPRSRKGSIRRDPNLRAQEELLEERFDTKVHIKQKGERGTIVIEYYSKEDLKRLMKELT